MAALDEIVRAGKARFAGASNMRTWHLAAAQMAAQTIGFGGYATMQNHYNLLYREDERDLIPFCHDQNIGLMCWRPLARGRLGRPAGDATARGAVDDVADTLYGPPSDPILGDLAAVADARGLPQAQVALGWIVGKGIVPVVGATKPRHIDDAAAASDLALTAAEIATLERSYTPRALAELPWNAKNQTDPRTLAARIGRA
jgi:aryl-alcohol dehydrogenase-like predicted oxidoreductase